MAHSFLLFVDSRIYYFFIERCFSCRSTVRDYSEDIGAQLSFVGGNIAFGLLYADLVAVLHMVAYPTGDILGGRIDLQHLVDILVVESLFNNTFDVGEVGYHTVLVERFGFAMHGNNEIMSVQSFALAFITQMEIVRSGDCDSFFYVIHFYVSYAVKQLMG